MNPKSSLSKAARIYGIIITSIMILIFGTYLIRSFLENDIGETKEFTRALIHWHDDPTAFFLSYLIGYAIVWWKPLWGSIIIILASLLVSIINIDNIGFLIFALLPFVVGLLYVSSWYEIKKREKEVL